MGFLLLNPDPCDGLRSLPSIKLNKRSRANQPQKQTGDRGSITDSAQPETG